jgi:organic hydroperoxide reductase OsmC/OhrA
LNRNEFERRTHGEQPNEDPLHRRSKSVALDLHAPQIDSDEAHDLMTKAHEICPYSRATRGNIDVTLTVGGSNFERQAA